MCKCYSIYNFGLEIPSCVCSDSFVFSLGVGCLLGCCWPLSALVSLCIAFNICNIIGKFLTTGLYFSITGAADSNIFVNDCTWFNVFVKLLTPLTANPFKGCSGCIGCG